MISRPFWTHRVEAAWKRAPIVWLAGVRRVGKTTLARGLRDAVVLNCDLPSVSERLSDPETFLANPPARRLVLDEIHQLPDPTRVLKIAADEHPRLRILATGSSTLAASAKFRDTLTGRKRVVSLPPVLITELEAFGADLERRMLRGGLPAVLLAEDHDAEGYAEWMDSYFARDVAELFRVDKRSGFLALLELLLRGSGGLVEVSKLGSAAGISRPTANAYLEVLQVTQTIRVLRPFHGASKQEILDQPKIYGFDTGFVAWSRGWGELRREDMGLLWEHLVLDLLCALVDPRDVHFWRDKRQREVDFVVERGRGVVDAIECKMSVRGFDAKGLAAFRALHPKGRNFVVVPAGAESHTRRFGDLEATIVAPAHLAAAFDDRRGASA
jgi:predicted AAA+ superfamily ATPase